MSFDRTSATRRENLCYASTEPLSAMTQPMSLATEPLSLPSIAPVENRTSVTSVYRIQPFGASIFATQSIRLYKEAQVVSFTAQISNHRCSQPNGWQQFWTILLIPNSLCLIMISIIIHSLPPKVPSCARYSRRYPI
jgi:hypothetical protein